MTTKKEQEKRERDIAEVNKIIADANKIVAESNKIIANSDKIIADNTKRNLDNLFNNKKNYNTIGTAVDFKNETVGKHKKGKIARKKRKAIEKELADSKEKARREIKKIDLLSKKMEAIGEEIKRILKEIKEDPSLAASMQEKLNELTGEIKGIASEITDAKDSLSNHIDIINQNVTGGDVSSSKSSDIGSISSGEATYSSSDSTVLEAKAEISTTSDTLSTQNFVSEVIVKAEPLPAPEPVKQPPPPMPITLPLAKVVSEQSPEFIGPPRPPNLQKQEMKTEITPEQREKQAALKERLIAKYKVEGKYPLTKMVSKQSPEFIGPPPPKTEINPNEKATDKMTVPNVEAVGKYANLASQSSKQGKKPRVVITKIPIPTNGGRA